MDDPISLTQELMDLIQAKVASGHYASANDVVRAALRLLDEADQIDTLRRAWHEGIASGDAGPLDFAELREAARMELAASRKN